MQVYIEMPSTKLIIRKHEESKNCKSLQILIDDDEHSANVHFGKWADGTIDTNKSTKSPCLIVKIVSTFESDLLNLESSAKLLEPDKVNEYLDTNTDCRLNNNNRIIHQNDSNEFTEKHINNVPKDYINPLQYSLDRVNENNARIMENIKILNRTLDLTKSQEILDTIYTRSLRHPYYRGSNYIHEAGIKKHFNCQHLTTECKTQQRWQIVWTCIQCFQVWPRRDQAIEHPGDSCNPKDIEGIREIKTSSLLQCEFCEKVFTSIPRLLTHSKLHSVVNNYECTTCSLTFKSYKTNEQHWLVCPWLKIYSFELPKFLLCNICDRKFKNYDQLYNHRYKAEHFMLKIIQDIKTDEPMIKASISILAHQCELCGLWYNALSEVKAHRTQVHQQFDAIVY
ncbi:zinc finger protein 280B-like [Bombyx mandarina]|uniref:Zinc finger protein 280B-like n=1 Tax=Bombyx mandarina TaxID=7092 RepID=A0A6J2JGJ6_BOMMA|nr:zinc finger protein 280B-like [Bombyx mandarina]